MLDLWVGLTNINGREIFGFKRRQMTFGFHYVNADGAGNPVFVNLEPVLFIFDLYAHGKPPSVSGMLAAMEPEGLAFFTSPINLHTTAHNTAPPAEIQVAAEQMAVELTGLTQVQLEAYRAQHFEKQDLKLKQVQIQVHVTAAEMAEMAAMSAKALMEKLAMYKATYGEATAVLTHKGKPIELKNASVSHTVGPSHWCTASGGPKPYLTSDPKASVFSTPSPPVKLGMDVEELAEISQDTCTFCDHFWEECVCPDGPMEDDIT